MIFYRFNILFLLIFNILLSGYLFNPENIGLAGTGSIAYNDMRSINPATLSNHKGFSIQIVGANFGVGNSALSISDYNDINGSNFDDPTASKYFPKKDVLSLFDDGLGFDSQLAFSIPFSDIVYNNISFSSRSYCSLDARLPQSLIELALYGNEMNKSYDLSIDNSINIFSEYSFGYAKKISSISIGVRAKYLQGLASGKLTNISDSSSYFYTDSIGFSGKAEYLITQSVGGSGIAFDIGFLSNNPIKGWVFGASLSNLFARIKWDDNNITYNFFEDNVISHLPLRNNEKQYFSINLDTLNALSMINLPVNEIYNTQNLTVIEINNIDNLDFINWSYDEHGDSILVSDYGEIIATEYGSYLLESTKINDDMLKNISASNTESYKTQYPIFFNLSSQKEIDENILLAIDLSTGFNSALKNSKKWKLSTGLLFNRFKNIPITLGLSFGGDNKIESGFSIGYEKGPLLINYGLATRNGIFIPSIKGVDFSFSLIFKTDSFKKQIFYKNKKQ